MGLSHLAMLRVHPEVELVAICDTTRLLLDMLAKNTGLAAYTDIDQMLDQVRPDALLIATPTQFHESLVRYALERGIHVFCEKPLCLDWPQSAALAALANSRGIVHQVGYHYRFVAAFQEMKRLLDLGAIGPVTHVLAEASGPVVLRPAGVSWRTRSNEGGGCLYDYAAHPINLLNWFFGMPIVARGTVIQSIFSRDTDDEVYGTLDFANNLSAQVAVNWSDESQRKMSVRISASGHYGRITADRQECQTYLRPKTKLPPGYATGWNIRYTTDLTPPVWFYVRGEEYSAQIDAFISAINSGSRDNVNSFDSAAQTDRVLAMMRQDAAQSRESHSKQPSVPAFTQALSPI